MGLELWSYSNNSPRKSCATKRDAAAETRSPIRRRNAPPVIRRTIDLRRLPSTTFLSPSVRDALRAADASRRPRSVDIANAPDVLESETSPADEVSAVREAADATFSRLLGMELSSRPTRDSYSGNLDENARSSGPTRTTAGSLLRRARPLRDSDAVGRSDAAIIAAARRSRVTTNDLDDARYAERRAVRRRENERNQARAHARARSVTRLNHWALPDAADFPPLRRMGRRQVTDGPMPPSGLRQSTLRDSWSPTNVDGLGDRERSVSSPPSDHWETMLTTITPDAQLPSADSSFTSAAASASFSASNTTSQTGTQSSRSVSDGSTPTEITEPMIDRSYEEQLFCETEDEVDSDDMAYPSVRPRDRDRTHFLRRGRSSSEELGNHHWATAPSPPARNPSRYADAHARLREITNAIRGYQPPGSRSQSPRSGNDGGVDRFAGPLANDDRRDSAAIVSNVSRPGSARNEQDREIRDFPAGTQEQFSMYLVDPNDPEQTPHRVPVYSIPTVDESREFVERHSRSRPDHHLRHSDHNRAGRDDLLEILYPMGYSDMETASIEAVRARRRAERAAAAERAVVGRLAERPADDEI